MSVQITDVAIAYHDERAEVLGGLTDAPKKVSPKYFYDEAGSLLFDAICEQPEYYPTRTELGIMERILPELVDLIGTQASLIEFGSGTSMKTKLLLQALSEPAAYVPVDIAREHLEQAANELANEFPQIEILPVCADFTQPFDLPSPRVLPRKNVVFFPGSTIGNFSKADAVDLLHVMRAEAKDDGALLIGVDLEKPKDVLESAYNDAAGVTAEFNLNMLNCLNREFNADFETEAFRHAAVYDERKARIEMRLISLTNQSVRVAGEEISLAKDEYIVTEHSHKYSIERFGEMAGSAGFRQQQVWTDPNELFSVQYLVAA